MRKSISSFVCGFLLCGVVNGALPPRADLTHDLKLRDSLAAILRKVPQASPNYEEAKEQLDTIADMGPSDATFGMLLRGFNSRAIDILKRESEILKQALTAIPCESPNYRDAQGQLEIMADMDPSDATFDRLFGTIILRTGEILAKEAAPHPKKEEKPTRAEEPKPSVRPLTPLSWELANAFVPLQNLAPIQGDQEIQDVIKILCSLSKWGFGESLDGGIIRIDLSFNRVKACAERLLRTVAARNDGTAHCSLPQLKLALENFYSVDWREKVCDLSSFCRRKIFSIDRGSADRINRLLPEMARNETGYCRLLSLLTIFSLKANGIAIGSVRSLTPLPLIKIEVDSSPSSKFISYCKIDGDQITIRLANDASASTFEHELTHAFHSLILPGISDMNPSMMEAVFRSFKGQIKIPYDKALFPMFSYSPRIVQEIVKVLSGVPQAQVKQFLSGPKFASIFATLKSGGFSPSGITSDNVIGLAGIIFPYICCFNEEKQIWVDPEEVLTIYGRVPFRFYTNSGQSVTVEIIDQDSQSSFDKRTILFHDGRICDNYERNLRDVFISFGISTAIADTTAQEIFRLPRMMFRKDIADEIRTKLENPALKDIVARHQDEIPPELLREGNFDKIRAFILETIAAKK